MRVGSWALWSLFLVAGVASAQEAPPERRGVKVIPPSKAAPEIKADSVPNAQVQPDLGPAPTPQDDPAPVPAPQVEPAPTPEPDTDAKPSLAENAAPEPAPCVRAFETADLTFTNDRASDRKLSALFTEKRERVVVDAEAPFAADRPPVRLEPWLAELQRAGGSVARQEIKCTRGFGFLKKLLGGLFSKPSQPDLHASARGYDAILWTDAGTGEVRQIEFKHRSGDPG